MADGGLSNASRSCARFRRDPSNSRRTMRRVARSAGASLAAAIVALWSPCGDMGPARRGVAEQRKKSARRAYRKTRGRRVAWRSIDGIGGFHVAQSSWSAGPSLEAEAAISCSAVPATHALNIQRASRPRPTHSTPYAARGTSPGAAPVEIIDPNLRERCPAAPSARRRLSGCAAR